MKTTAILRLTAAAALIFSTVANTIISMEKSTATSTTLSKGAFWSHFSQCDDLQLRAHRLRLGDK
ncbi:MAG: hypothetical protein ACKO7B_11360 [Flavobacteriales bacterium]